MSFVETIGLPDATADETAKFATTGIHPAKELLLNLPRRLACLDVFLQRGTLEVGGAAVIDEVKDGIELALGGDALHLIGDGLELLEVFTQELFGLVLRDAVALLHVLRMAVADRPHAFAVLISRERHALELLDRLNQCAACSHTSFSGSMSCF